MAHIGIMQKENGNYYLGFRVGVSGLESAFSIW